MDQFKAFIKKNYKEILRWFIIACLTLIALGMLLAFLSVVTATDNYGQTVYLRKMKVTDFVFFWIVILGAGVPAGFLLRKAIVQMKSKRSEGAAFAADENDAAEEADEAEPAHDSENEAYEDDEALDFPEENSEE